MGARVLCSLLTSVVALSTLSSGCSTGVSGEGPEFDGSLQNEASIDAEPMHEAETALDASAWAVFTAPDGMSDAFEPGDSEAEAGALDAPSGSDATTNDASAPEAGDEDASDSSSEAVPPDAASDAERSDVGSCDDSRCGSAACDVTQPCPDATQVCAGGTCLTCGQATTDGLACASGGACDEATGACD